MSNKKLSSFLERLKETSAIVESWPDWKKNQLGAEYVTRNHHEENLPVNFTEEESDPEELDFDSPNGSVWIVAVDIQGLVTILKAPNIHYSYFDNGKSAEDIGLPCEVEDVVPGVYRWTCDLISSKDWETGIVDDYEFQVEEQELLWSLESA